MVEMEEADEIHRPYGNYGVLCGGAILVHPLRPWWWLLEFYTILVQIVFVTEYHIFHTWVLISGMATGLVAITVTLKATLTNPGICPKPSPKEARENETEALRQKRNFQYPTNAGRVSVMKPNPKYDPVKSPLAPRNIEYSYCPRCRMFKPPFTTHCYTCDCCVTHQDHHCPVFGGCVGPGNIVWFYGMIIILPVYWIFMLVVTSSAMFIPNSDPSDPDYKPALVKTSYTLYFVLVGFMGALVCPVILRCPSLDRVHRTRHRPTLLPTSRIRLPQNRNPPPQTPGKPESEDSKEELNANDCLQYPTEDNVNQNITISETELMRNEIHTV